MNGAIRPSAKLLTAGCAIRLGRVPSIRPYATHVPGYSVAPTARHHRALVVGCGSAGLNAAHQLLRTGRFAQDDIGTIDPAEWHHYQPGWTLVGAGLKTKEHLRKPLKSLIDPKIKFYNNSVATFSPEESLLTLGNGTKLSYDHLVVAPGIRLDLDSITGLREAVTNPDSNVASIYSYDSCDRVWDNIAKFRKGKALFTHPAGPVKCAGAPQKIMWLASDKWNRTGLYDMRNPSSSPIQISLATALPSMFAVPKYTDKLEALRKERGVEGLFQHDLISIQGNTATFARLGGASPGSEETVKRKFDFLHVVPKMGPHEFVKNSPLANEAGFVQVDDNTLQHKRFPNVWSCGDASSLPTSKTVAAITAQTPVLVQNLLAAIDGKAPESRYDGYTSCPLLTSYGKVMLAEFRYGGHVKETFGPWLGDQSVPRRLYYHLKKDFFPWVYYKSMVKGTWAGPKGWMK